MRTVQRGCTSGALWGGADGASRLLLVGLEGSRVYRGGGGPPLSWRRLACLSLYKLIYLGVCVVVELAQLKAAILKLLREDEEFRYAVAGLIGLEEILKRLDRHEELLVELFKKLEKHEEELVKIWEELARLREDMNKGFQRHDQLFAEIFKRLEHYDQLFAEILKRLEQHDQLFAEIFKRFEHYDQLFAEVFKRLDRHEEELVRLREDMNKGFQRYDQLFAEVFKRLDRQEERIGRVEEELAKLRADMNRGFDRLQRRLDALGARWGVMSEAAFREGLRSVVEEELGLRVERWTAYDEEGKVFGFPSEVEVDVAVKDGKVILIEITSHARLLDVYAFKRKADLYAEKEGRRPDRLIIITPYADEDAKRVAERLGIEIYAGGD